MIRAFLLEPDCQGQRLGIDRIVQLGSGRTLKIDEKKRERDYGDILLEFVSVDRTNAPGWMEKDLQIDYLAYAFLPSQRCYLLPWNMLRRVWANWGRMWISYGAKNLGGFDIVAAANRGYQTWSVAVPTKVLTTAIKNAMVIQL